MAIGFRWSWIPNGTVVLLIFVNVTLAAIVTSRHFELKRLQEEEQNSLHENFPPLKRTQVSSYLNQLFPGSVEFDHATFGKTIKYRVYDQTTLLGNAYQVREDIHCPVCRDVRFFIGVDIDNIISGIVLVNPFHFYGEPLKAEIVDEFLGQFLNRQVSDQLHLGSNIHGITGATKTVEHFLDGVVGIQKLHFE